MSVYRYWQPCVANADIRDVTFSDVFCFTDLFSDPFCWLGLHRNENSEPKPKILDALGRKFETEYAFKKLFIYFKLAFLYHLILDFLMKFKHFNDNEFKKIQANEITTLLLKVTLKLDTKYINIKIIK